VKAQKLSPVSAHAEADQHVGLQSCGNLCRRISRASAADPAKAAPERLDLEQAQDDEHEGNDAEAEHALQTAADRPQHLYEPRHIYLLGEQLGGIEAALLDEVGRMHV
jgi:hypothetical protein